MQPPLFEQLHQEGLISDISMERIRRDQVSPLFSIHWELRTILYIGILLLTGGLGILVGKNIDTIGHQAILALIAILCIGSFAYCERLKLPFSRTKVLPPNPYFDYVLLLGCLAMITFIAYLQAQYNAFGNAYGLATFIPMVILFACAYHFDHLGVLSLAIANLAAWAGIAVTPLTIFRSNDFADARLIFTGLAVGTLLTVVSSASENKDIKPHFSFTYLNFGMNLLFVSCLAGMFHFESAYLLWLLPLAGITWYFYRKALALRSFYFVLMIALYVYVGAGFVLTSLISAVSTEAFSLLMLYFIGSAVYMIVFLMNVNKKLKAHASL